MKSIKAFFMNIKAVSSVLYILINRNKLTNFQKELILSLNDDLKNKRITLEQHQQEIISIKKVIKLK